MDNNLDQEIGIALIESETFSTPTEQELAIVAKAEELHKYNSKDYSVEELLANPFAPYERFRDSFRSGNNSLVSFEKIRMLYTTGCFPAWVSTPQQALMVGAYSEALQIEPVLMATMLYIYEGKINIMYQAYTTVICENAEIETVRDWDPVYLTDNPKNYYLEGNLKLFPRYEVDANGKSTGVIIGEDPYYLGKATTIKCKRNGQNHYTYTTFTEEMARNLGNLAPKTKSGKDNESLWIRNPSVMAWAKVITLIGRRYFYDLIIKHKY